MASSALGAAGRAYAGVSSIPSADSGERDRPFRPKVITDSGDRDDLDPLGGGPG
jgi:hypothetical protein